MILFSTDKQFFFSRKCLEMNALEKRPKISLASSRKKPQIDHLMKTNITDTQITVDRVPREHYPKHQRDGYELVHVLTRSSNGIPIGPVPPTWERLLSSHYGYAWDLIGIEGRSAALYRRPIAITEIEETRKAITRSINRDTEEYRASIARKQKGLQAFDEAINSGATESEAYKAYVAERDNL